MITLKTLPQATAQEVFDQIVQHLLTQLVHAQTKTTGVCRYRIEKQSGQTLKCAAGCLIADDEYNRLFENVSWNDLVNGGKVPKQHAQLIWQFQWMHDKELPEDWPHYFHKIAKDFGLAFHPQPS